MGWDGRGYSIYRYCFQHVTGPKDLSRGATNELPFDGRYQYAPSKSTGNQFFSV